MNWLFSFGHGLVPGADDKLRRWQPAHDYSTGGWAAAGWVLFILGCVLMLAAGLGIVFALPGIFILHLRWRYARRAKLLNAESELARREQEWASR